MPHDCWNQSLVTTKKTFKFQATHWMLNPFPLLCHHRIHRQSTFSVDNLDPRGIIHDENFENFAKNFNALGSRSLVVFPKKSAP